MTTAYSGVPLDFGGRGGVSVTRHFRSAGMAAPNQCWDPSLYDDKHAFVWHYGASLVELLAPSPGERILDLGCGTGHLTSQIAQADATVVGLDHSAEMLEQARAAY